MMTSSNGNIFRITGAVPGGIPSRLKASDMELWCFLWSAPEQTSEQTNETPVIWDAIALVVTMITVMSGQNSYHCRWPIHEVAEHLQVQRRSSLKKMGTKRYQLMLGQTPAITDPNINQGNT